MLTLVPATLVLVLAGSAHWLAWLTRRARLAVWLLPLLPLALAGLGLWEKLDLVRSDGGYGIGILLIIAFLAAADPWLGAFLAGLCLLLVAQIGLGALLDAGIGSSLLVWLVAVALVAPLTVAAGRRLVARPGGER